jgi:uncharacterized protein
MRNRHSEKRYSSINNALYERFGERVYKVSLESGLSCPNKDGTIGSSGCIFCNTDSYIPKTTIDGEQYAINVGELTIGEQLETGIEYVKGRHGAKKVISYFQSGSNTHAAASTLKPIFEEAIDHPSVVGLAISTRPDCILDEHAELFDELSRKTFLWVELGLQSSHDSTLKLIERGHSVEQFVHASDLLKKFNIPICVHTILGLPGESLEMMLTTAKFLNEQDVWGAKIHNLHVLKDTKLEKMYRNGECNIPSLKEYACWVASFLETLNPNILIHRLNSHSPKRFTIAPEWSVNKLATFNEIEKQLKETDSWQGKRYIP